MNRILVFGASNSKNSINKKLAVYTASTLENVELDILDLNDFDMPIFGVDYEAENGIPKLAHEFLMRIEKSDGIIISFAEHNGVYSTAFKNVFDWVSRIRGDLWSGKPMFALATSPGKRGGGTVLQIAIDRFQFMGGNIVASFSLPSFYEHFDQVKGIVEESLKQVYSGEIEKFASSLK